MGKQKKKQKKRGNPLWTLVFLAALAVFWKRSEFVSIISVPLSFVNLCPRKRIAPAPIL